MTEILTCVSSSEGKDQYQLRFIDLFNRGRAYAFPCDPKGNVDIDRLTERARLNYHYATALIGKELSPPIVVLPLV